MTIGQVPVEVCELVTTRLPSALQASVICRLPVRASKSETVVTAGGASATTHPSMVVEVILPVTDGAVLSMTVTIFVHVDVQPFASVMVRFNVYDVLHPKLAVMVTDWFVELPEIEPFPEILQA